MDADWRQLWAKTAQDSSDCHYHPLLCHMLDIAAVAGLVWDDHLTSGLRKRLESALGVGDARTYVVFVAGAHDIGKACPGFQKKMPKLCERLQLPFSTNDQDRPHGFISACVLKESLGPCSTSALLGQIAGGHHGVFPRSVDTQMGRDSLGNSDWTTARRELLSAFANAIGFDLNRAFQCRAETSTP